MRGTHAINVWRSGTTVTCTTLFPDILFPDSFPQYRIIGWKEFCFVIFKALCWCFLTSHVTLENSSALRMAHLLHVSSFPTRELLQCSLPRQCSEIILWCILPGVFFHSLHQVLGGETRDLQFWGIFWKYSFDHCFPSVFLFVQYLSRANLLLFPPSFLCRLLPFVLF